MVFSFASTVSRTLDALRGQGRLSEGVSLANGGRLRILIQASTEPLRTQFGSNSVDSRIVAVALAQYKAFPDIPTILVSKDINLRIKADALGLQAEDYETDRIFLQDLYTGMFERQVGADKMTAFRSNGELEIAPGKARCGIYAHRPLVCSNFPASLQRGVVTIREDTVCGPGSWNLATMDLPTYRRDLTRDQSARAEHRQVMRAWNKVVDDSRWEATPEDLYEYLLKCPLEGEAQGHKS